MVLLASTCFINVGCIGYEVTSTNIYSKNDSLSNLIMKIDSSRNSHDRLILSDSLPNMAIKQKKAGLCFDDNSISALIRLLQDGEDGVRMNASIALGEAGSQAARALPFLEEVLDTENQPAGQIGPDLGSSSTIPRAIEKIRRSQRFPDHCRSAKTR